MTETADGLDSPEQTLRRGAQHLAELHPALDAQLVERIVFESHATLVRGARIRHHLPPLALKFAADRLRALEGGDRRGEGGPLRIMIESIRNDGISQMAAAYLNALGEGRVEALSGAISPADVVLRTVVDVMEEDGVPLGEAYPKPITDDVARSADVIVTMLIEHPFDLAPGQRIEQWDFDDPAGRGTDEVRRIRDRVRRRVQDYLDGLDA
ncbi:Low molecular weight phosphotyrosine protein phosphatase [Agrococcus baldri]|uniref:Low molecular weight phosphotyrosine protein phosphatase n=1 Tax=Agrococcus baldri TaxID=153730 RepID=A0AA94KYG1_9MICO|nr:arsenate reductase ArsC [Agrococcus baldri]SFR98562.1 Low molecular weight phosphotyrosine protein phosphatase [Agrococcus baldri]